MIFRFAKCYNKFGFSFKAVLKIMSMCLVKRIIPFAAALTLGLFVASFFVTVSAPRFNFKRNYDNRGYKNKRSLERDNQRLQEQIRQQQLRIEELETIQTADFESRFEPVPPPPPTVSRRTR